MDNLDLVYNKNSFSSSNSGFSLKLHKCKEEKDHKVNEVRSFESKYLSGIRSLHNTPKNVNLKKTNID